MHPDQHLILRAACHHGHPLVIAVFQRIAHEVRDELCESVRIPFSPQIALRFMYRMLALEWNAASSTTTCSQICCRFAGVRLIGILFRAAYASSPSDP